MDTKRGQLKIFFGYASGIGKTKKMLECALEYQEKGNKVAIGYIAKHEEKTFQEFFEYFPIIMMEQVFDGESYEYEMNIDKVLQEKPDLLVIDELAHKNKIGSRHEQRYKDIEEILNAGIDVYTTLNIEEIESLSDVVKSITKSVRDIKVPDIVFDEANQVELVDSEPSDLLQCVHTDLSIQQLEALREVAYRRCGERMHYITSQKNKDNHYFTSEHILVCLSSSPSNQKIIRTAARLANMFHGDLTALYVEVVSDKQSSNEECQQLRENIALAKRLGAQVEKIANNDIAKQITEYAHLMHVSKIVIGRSPKRLWPFQKTLVDQLSLLASDLDIYIIPHTENKVKRYFHHQTIKISVIDILKCAVIMAIVTLLGMLFQFLGFSEANIITIYILGVLLISITTSEKIYGVFSSLISVLIFNFLFTKPYFTFLAYDSGYPVTFVIMFIAAFMTSNLVMRVKQSAKYSAEMAYRTKVLLETNQLLQKETTKQGIMQVTCQQLSKLLAKDILFYGIENARLTQPIFHKYHEDTDITSCLTPFELSVAQWVYHNNEHAGASTHTLSQSECLYLAVRVKKKVYGIVGIRLKEAKLDSFDNNVVLSLLGETALALENEQSLREKMAADVRVENEQLRANLLRSISHDLRTPLTSISGNAGILLSSEASLDKEKRLAIYKDIYDESFWLTNLVENLLSITKIEQGTMNMKMNTELIDDIIQVAISYMNRHLHQHKIELIEDNEFILVCVDAHLIVQVLINLLDNAIKYTPKHSTITIHSYVQDEWAYIDIQDEGEGINKEDKEKIFDMFYTINHGIADGRKSMGLGLSLCQSIIEAHKGHIEVLDNKPNGSIFRFMLPLSHNPAEKIIYT